MQTLAVTVRPIDVQDDAVMRRWYDLTEAADTHERPWATSWSFPEMLVTFRTEDGAMRRFPVAAFDGEEMVGTAFMMLPLQDNTEKVYGGIFVAPQFRNRGVGSALVDHLVETMQAEGRTTLLVEAGVPGSAREAHPYTRFARKNGFTMANVEVHRVLDLPIETSVLEGMRAEAAAHHQGYQIETFHDEIPDELLDSYLFLLGQLAVDAPSGEIDFEAEVVTREIWARQSERLRAQGRHRLMSLAISADGEAVAHSDLLVPPEDRPKAYQWGTLVRRDHRGHHLGAAVKVANVLALQERYPDRTEIHTTNAEDNATMIGINERFGFRVVEICPEFMLKV
ncbi:MAG TPA: GNAT family N-acetyltransferase [Nocardioidaceae bacterium]|nr:GNAT family N-acetyltransferase [Nocardioidaceae bacterium]